MTLDLPFRLRDHRCVELFAPERLSPSAWNDRRAFLAEEHPTWRFESAGTAI